MAIEKNTNCIMKTKFMPTLNSPELYLISGIVYVNPILEIHP